MSLAATIVYHNRQNLVRESLKPMAAHVGSSKRIQDRVRYMVQAGERVHRRQPLVVIESMKMESLISSPQDGQVAEVLTAAGQTLETGETLIRFK